MGQTTGIDQRVRTVPATAAACRSAAGSRAMITTSATAAIPNASSTTRAASTGTSGRPSRDRPHQGMVRA